jgi:hypothetical protein
MKRKLVIFAGVVIVVLAAGALYRALQSPAPGPMGESIPPDEDVYTAQIINSGVSMINSTRRAVGDGHYRRDAHAKTHGCALATFAVSEVAAPLRQGLFASPQTYKAWVRFSSGSTTPQSDWKPDARGLAIKVLGVPGAKLLDGEQDDRTQDFLMIDNPVFFIRNVREYARLTQFQAEGSQFGYFFAGSPLHWPLREFRIGAGLLKWPPRALLTTRFYSMSAYTLGPLKNVKYSARPVACSPQSNLPSHWVSWDRDGLGKDLNGQLKAGPACFEFMVQVQDPTQNMPVEDTTVRWEEKFSRFIPVARIEIAKQDIQPALDNGFCENLSFTPWHALPEHRPIGGLNRVRKAVYQGISRYRRCMNGRFFGEPKDDGSMAFDTRACDPHDPVPPIPAPSGVAAPAPPR